MSITQAQLAGTFAAMGLTDGDSVILHSSFRVLRPFDGTPADVLRVLRSVIGKGGNIMLPTFNYTSPPPEPYFEVNHTPARTGAIVEAGRKLPGAVRSSHPTHSVAVIGPDAEALTADHLTTRALGIGSPIDRLAQRGGKILLLGTGNMSNSTIHIAEEHAQVPKVIRPETPPSVKLRMPDGSIVDHPLDSSPSCSAGFESAAFALRRDGLIRDGRAGGCLMQLMRGRDVIDSIAAMLREYPTVLLCTNPHCASCTGVRKNLAS